jgi:acetoacetyl-CoA synthetase
MSEYTRWLEKRGFSFSDYNELWNWSVEDLEGFWGTIWKYFDVSDADYPVLRDRKMPGAKWFEGSEVNFAERVFAKKRDGTALLAKRERAAERAMSWQELERQTAALAEKLRETGVVAGDRVAGFLPNSSEAVVGLLASASVGAVWSCCSPDFGAPAALDRFSQVGPKVLIAADGYAYGGKWFDRRKEVASIAASLPTLQRVVGVRWRSDSSEVEGAVPWDDLVAGKAAPAYEPLPFDHPLWILYSSGTTGLPKAIVHGHGGILVELYKELALHNDIREGDRFFWFTTTGWMMWNYLVGGLLHGATIVLYSGSPAYPRQGYLWELADKTQTTFMGASAAYFHACMKAGLEPKSSYGLRKLRGVGSTGSPLSPETFEWVYSAAGEELWLASLSGGTDVCTAFVGGSPVLPVYSGEIQCRCLGAKVEAYDEEGKPVRGRVGELVVTEPMPSMPLFLWGDEDGARYHESYFSAYPGVWRHGDWIEITTRGTCVIYGRSDATIKRMGVRIGTSEIYRAVEAIPEVRDSLALDLGRGDEGGEMVLFVVTGAGAKLDKALEDRVRAKIASDLSPKYVPDLVLEAPGVPRTLSGKKLEVPVKRILTGVDPANAVNRDSIADPSSMEFYLELAKKLAARKEA